MKTILSLFVMMILATAAHSQTTLAIQNSVSSSIYSNKQSVPPPGVLIHPRVLKAFSLTFPSVTDAMWHEAASLYTVNFRIQQIAISAVYDEAGTLIKMRRTYSADFLAPSVLIAVQKKHPTKTIAGITEVTDGEEFLYEVTLNDETHWYKLMIDASGQMETVQKFRRGEPK